MCLPSSVIFSGTTPRPAPANKFIFKFCNTEIVDYIYLLMIVGIEGGAFLWSTNSKYLVSGKKIYSEF